MVPIPVVWYLNGGTRGHATSPVQSILHPPTEEIQARSEFILPKRAVDVLKRLVPLGGNTAQHNSKKLFMDFEANLVTLV